MSQESELRIPSVIQAFSADPANWGGSGYELGMQFAASSLGLAQRKALFETLWRSFRVIGAVDDQRKLGYGWQPAEEVSTESGAQYYGYLSLTEKQIVGCGSCFIDTQSASWFVFYIPTGMLELAFAIDYPIGAHANLWRRDVDDRLVSIARRIYVSFPFMLGVVGEEASSFWPLQQLLSLKSDEPPICCLVPEAVMPTLRLGKPVVKYPEGLYRLDPPYEKH